MKAVQYFTDEYLRESRKLTPDQVLQFLDDFRRMHGVRDGPPRLISLKVPESLLNAFRARCGLEGRRYQTQIKVLMREWLERSGDG
jgi:uncharacterized protein (DUF4415 family)